MPITLLPSIFLFSISKVVAPVAVRMGSHAKILHGKTIQKVVYIHIVVETSNVVEGL
jgi:hypothetical protein